MNLASCRSLTRLALRPVAELLHDIRPSVFSSPGGHLDFLEKYSI